jgi:glycosyltransferase involved in cell wall biosynthesis
MAEIYLIGVRGIPNRYGGFERLVEVLAPDLVSRGHKVTVFCEVGDDISAAGHDIWNGVRRHYVNTYLRGPLGTIEYDLRSFFSVPPGAIAIIFGYGTGTFQRRLRRLGIRHAVNMDGIEWQREKWGRIARIWLRFNEREAAQLGDELIADHPEIQAYLKDRLCKMSTMIAYGVDDSALHPPESLLDHPLLVQYPAQGYFLVVARPEPENQIHVLLAAYEASRRTLPMIVLGNYSANAYGRKLQAAHREVVFAGAVYDSSVLDALRRRSALYLHGHSVGGTNPSLIEAMAAGALVVAHDNKFNRWVLGNEAGLYFQNVHDLKAILDKPPLDADERISMIEAAKMRCRDEFRWVKILSAYSEVIDRLVAK